MEQLEDRVALHGELEVRPHRCQEKTQCVHDYRIQKIKHLKWNQADRMRSVKAKTFKEVAGHYSASASTIVRRFDVLALQELTETATLPRVIAIDEYKGYTREGKYQLIIANLDTKEPIDILPNRKKKTIKHYLQQHGATVEIVVMDMSSSFKAAVQQALSKPVIIADRFHFCRYICWALDGVRRRVQKNWNDYDCKRESGYAMSSTKTARS